MYSAEGSNSANYYVPIQRDDETPAPEKKRTERVKPRYTPRILVRRFALTHTSYKYLEIGISVGPTSHVELLLGDNRGNQILLPHATWTAFIERRTDIEQLLQSTAASSLQIRELLIQLTKIRDGIIVKFTLHDNCLYMMPSTVLFLLELKLCIEHAYFWLFQNTYSVSEKYTQFVTILRRNYVTEKYEASRFLREYSDTNSVIDCELLAYALENIVYDAVHDN